MRRRLGWRGPPLALQILALLLGGLIVAQLVTLLLTVVLPPAPKAQYGLADIAAALASGGDASRAGATLERHVQPGPPDVSGAGWLVSETSRHELALLLDRRDAEVALAFYTPLPFAGTTTARPLAALANDGPSTPSLRGALRPAALLLLQPPGGGAPALPNAAPPIPPAAALPRGSFPPGTLGEGGPGGGFGGMLEGGSPTGGLRGGFGEGGARGRPIGIAPPPGGADHARSGSTLYSVNPRAVQVGPGGTFIPGDGGAAVPPLLGGPAQPAVPPAAPPPISLPAGGRGTPPPPLPPAFGAPPAQVDPGASGRTLPGRDLLAAPFAVAQPQAPTPRRQQADPATTRAAPAPSAAVTIPDALAPGAPAAEAGAPAIRAPADVPAPAPYGPPIAIAPPRGLFGLAPAPFVEGDFVAALRLSDGRWSVVQPAAEPFPNAWQRRVLLWFALAFAIVAPVGWLFARRLVTPLARFASAAERLGRDPAAAILPLAGPAEIGRAANAFNLMRSRLRSFVEDRTAMIGAISHDLRTPLTRMRFRIEDTDGEVREGLLEEVDAMEAMITQVIAFIRDASMPGVRERLDLGALVDDVVEDAQMIGKDVTIDRGGGTRAVPVEVDVLGIRRVLDNLLENAVKYGVRARVRLTTEADSALAEIVDDGPGLPDDELERVFEPFYRGERARASDKAGSGLGLAVCRSIARAHGGDVVLLRARDGFSAQVRLPLAFDADRPLAA